MKRYQAILVVSMMIHSLGAAQGVNDPRFPAETQRLIEKVTAVCREDFEKNCAGKTVGHGLIKCVRRHVLQLSDTCMDYLREHRAEIREARRAYLCRAASPTPRPE